MLTPEVFKGLQEIVGADHVTQEPAILDSYAFQPFHKAAPGSWIHRPVAVVMPGGAEEVQAILKLCHKHRVRTKAHSTGFGANSGPGSEGVVQIDLRRMNRILEIDERNMIAVVEPYVSSAQLQAELIKKGLNLHIIGCGCHTSPLASCSSHTGTGWTGIATGYNGRNLIGAEWVLPDGSMIRTGTLGSGLGWFNGDGPGPSLRGVMRGWAGADGGLGVYTKISFKLYHWPGSGQPNVEGTLLHGSAVTPENVRFSICFLPSYEKWADACYKIGEAEIGYMVNKDALGLTLWTFAPHLARRIAQLPYLKEALKSMQHFLQIILTGYYPGDIEFQQKTLEKIVDECGGVLINVNELPSIQKRLWWPFLRSSLPPLIFRGGSNFFTSLGTDESIDSSALQAKVGEELKHDLITKGYIFDDLADNAWGGPYEYGLYCHMEQICLFDSRNAEQFNHLADYGEIMAQATIDRHLGGVGFALFMGNTIHERLGPVTSNYHIWQRKIKTAFDPEDLSDSKYYIASEKSDT